MGLVLLESLSGIRAAAAALEAVVLDMPEPERADSPPAYARLLRPLAPKAPPAHTGLHEHVMLSLMEHGAQSSLKVAVEQAGVADLSTDAMDA